MGGREGGRTNDMPGTDHVTSGPKKCLKKTAYDGADRQTGHGHADSITDSAQLRCTVKKENISINKVQKYFLAQFSLHITVLMASLIFRQKPEAWILFCYILAVVKKDCVSTW